MDTGKQPTKVDAERVLELAATFKDRTKTSLYISAGLYQRFQEACEVRGANASRAIEVLIFDFLADWDARNSAPNKRKGRS